MMRMGKQSVEFDVVVAGEDNVLDARHFNVLYGVFSSCGADHFAYVEPKMFQAFFLKEENGARKADDLQATLVELKKLMPDYADMRIGRSSGLLDARYSWMGKLKRPPEGEPLKKALAEISK